MLLIIICYDLHAGKLLQFLKPGKSGSNKLNINKTPFAGLSLAKNDKLYAHIFSITFAFPFSRVCVCVCALLCCCCHCIITRCFVSVAAKDFIVSDEDDGRISKCHTIVCLGGESSLSPH